MKKIILLFCFLIISSCGFTAKVLNTKKSYQEYITDIRTSSKNEKRILLIGKNYDYLLTSDKSESLRNLANRYNELFFKKNSKTKIYLNLKKDSLQGYIYIKIRRNNISEEQLSFVRNNNFFHKNYINHNSLKVDDYSKYYNFSGKRYKKDINHNNFEDEIKLMHNIKEIIYEEDSNLKKTAKIIFVAPFTIAVDILYTPIYILQFMMKGLSEK